MGRDLDSPGAEPGQKRVGPGRPRGGAWVGMGAGVWGRSLDEKGAEPGRVCGRGLEGLGLCRPPLLGLLVVPSLRFAWGPSSNAPGLASRPRFSVMDLSQSPGQSCEPTSRPRLREL